MLPFVLLFVLAFVMHHRELIRQLLFLQINFSCRLHFALDGIFYNPSSLIFFSIIDPAAF